MAALTVSEKILSAKAGRADSPARAGEIVVCHADVIIGTDGSGPMAIDYFERMGGAGARLKNPERVFFSLDHYAPPSTPETVAFHDRIRTFVARHGATVFGVGEGISHQVVCERGLARPGDLIVGADSHTVMCGALNAFAVGVGSSDLAAAMLTGQVWLRVPGTIRITLTGVAPAGVAAKDIALSLVAELGAAGADYCALEFTGDALGALDVSDRMVISSLMAEAGAKAAIFPRDALAESYLRARSVRRGEPVAADPGASYVRELNVDLAALTPRIAAPHAPDNVLPLSGFAGTPVHMVFVGTCTGGRVADFHAMRQAFDGAGGQLAPGVQLVLTPASREVFERLIADGTITHLMGAGATLTMAGCGACCGTSGVIPADGATVLSTANRNFRARMGNPGARIFLASPAVCGIAAATGRIPESVAAPGAPAGGESDAPGTGERGAP